MPGPPTTGASVADAARRPRGTLTTMSTATHLMGWTLAVLSCAAMVPQLRRLRRGVDSGISVTAVAAASLTMWSWCVYTTAERDWPALASSVGPLSVWLLLGATLTARRHDLPSFLHVLAVFAGGSVIAVSGAHGAMYAAAVGSMLWIVPQAVSVLRSGPLDGVSIGAYLLVLAENAGWVLYAWATGRWAYAAAPLIQVPLSVLIVLRTRADRRSRSRPRTNGDGGPAPAAFP